MQEEVQVGGKKRGFRLIVDDAPVPSRRASLRTRAGWALGYVRRMHAGEKISVRLVDQAIRWLSEAIEAIEVGTARRSA